MIELVWDQRRNAIWAVTTSARGITPIGLSVSPPVLPRHN